MANEMSRVGRAGRAIGIALGSPGATQSFLDEQEFNMRQALLDNQAKLDAISQNKEISSRLKREMGNMWLKLATDPKTPPEIREHAGKQLPRFGIESVPSFETPPDTGKAASTVGKINSDLRAAEARLRVLQKDPNASPSSIEATRREIADLNKERASRQKEGQQFMTISRHLGEIGTKIRSGVKIGDLPEGDQAFLKRFDQMSRSEIMGLLLQGAMGGNFGGMPETGQQESAGQSDFSTMSRDELNDVIANSPDEALVRRAIEAKRKLK